MLRRSSPFTWIDISEFLLLQIPLGSIHVQKSTMNGSCPATAAAAMTITVLATAVAEAIAPAKRGMSDNNSSIYTLQCSRPVAIGRRQCTKEVDTAPAVAVATTTRTNRGRRTQTTSLVAASRYAPVCRMCYFLFSTFSFLQTTACSILIVSRFSPHGPGYLCPCRSAIAAHGYLRPRLSVTVDFTFLPYSPETTTDWAHGGYSNNDKKHYHLCYDYC